MSPSAMAASAVWKVWSGSIDPNSSLSDNSSPESTMAESKDSDKLQQELTSEAPKGQTQGQDEGQPGQSPKPMDTSMDSMSTSTDTVDSGSRPQRLNMRARGAKQSSEPPSPKKARTLSERCFIALLWAIALVKLWKNFWILQLLPILIACLLIKKIGKWPFFFDQNLHYFS